MKKFSIFIAVTLFALTGNLIFRAPALSLEGGEYQIKAAMMVNFIQFVEWPNDPDLPADSLTIGVFGTDNFKETLDQIEGRIINGKRLAVRYLTSPKDLSQCQVVFVPESESYRMNEILRCVNGYPILTVGETDKFIQSGGIIRFYLEQNHVRFEINKTSAVNSKLKISAKLLEIARIVD